MTTNAKEVLKKSGFSSVPFHPVPRAEEAIWAGSTVIRDELVRITSEVKHGGLELSHLALIFGEYGSGKTHALNYLKSVLKNENNALVAYLAKPKVEKKGSFQGIAKEVIKQIGRKPLRQAVLPIVKYINDEANARAKEDVDLSAVDGDLGAYMSSRIKEVKRDIQEELYNPFPEILNVFEGLTKDETAAWGYFAAKPPAGSLAAYELNSPIEDDHDANRALAAIFNILTTDYDVIAGTPVYDAAYLFIDEMEQFLEIRSEEVLSIRTGLRDIFNSCTEHFCLILAATASTASTFYGLLEEAVMVRVTAEPMHIESHDEIEDGVSFIVELMENYRDGGAIPNKFHPFTENALESIVDRTGPPKTARKLILNCRRVWDGCSELIVQGSAISEDDVNDIHGLR